MGFLANVIHPAFLLVHGDEQVAGVDNVALAHIDAGNGAVLRSADYILSKRERMPLPKKPEAPVNKSFIK